MWRATGIARSVGVLKQVASIASGSSPSPATGSVAGASTQSFRCFAAGAPQSKEENVPIPIPMYGVPGKYASALYVTAVKGNVLEPVEQELNDVINAAHQNDVFGEFLKDPSVTKDNRMRAIQAIFGKESTYLDVTKNFLAVLAENGRLKEIYKIKNAYSELVLAHKGEVQATVTTALELSQEELLGLKDVLQGHIKPGQTLKIQQKVDKSLIVGIVIDVLDKHIDFSLDTRIKQMEKLLAESI